MNDSKKIKVNTFLNAIKTCTSIIFPLITFPYVSRILQSENLGKINFSASIVSYISLIASLGISTYAVRECSKVKKDKKKLSDLASQIYTINVFSTIIAYSILVIALLIVKKLNDYRAIIIIQSSSILFSTLGADWINNVEEDFKYITLRTIGFNVLSIILMFVFVKGQNDYTIYALILVISNAGSNILNSIYRRRFCTIKIVKNVSFRKHLKPILMLFSLQLVQIIYVSSDTTIIGFLRSDNEVGLYSAAVRIYTLIQTLMNSVVLVIIPQLTQAFSQKDYKKVNSLLRYSLNFIIGLGLPCLIGINVVANEIIELLAGQTYLGCIPALRILTIALFFSFLGGFLGNLIMIPSGKEKVCLISSIISAAANLILNLILIPFWGIEAAALTTAISMLIGFIYKIPYVDKEIRIGSLKSVILGPLIGCAIIVVIGILFSFIHIHYIIRFVAIVIMSVISYFITITIFKNELAISVYSSVKKNLHIKK